MGKIVVKKEKYTMISVRPKTKNMIINEMFKYKYRYYDDFLIDVMKILKQFKPELKEMKK